MVMSRAERSCWPGLATEVSSTASQQLGQRRLSLLHSDLRLYLEPETRAAGRDPQAHVVQLLQPLQQVLENLQGGRLHPLPRQLVPSRMSSLGESQGKPVLGLGSEQEELGP